MRRPSSRRRPARLSMRRLSAPPNCHSTRRRASTRWWRPAQERVLPQARRGGAKRQGLTDTSHRNVHLINGARAGAEYAQRLAAGLLDDQPVPLPDGAVLGSLNRSIRRDHAVSCVDVRVPSDSLAPSMPGGQG